MPKYRIFVNKNCASSGRANVSFHFISQYPIFGRLPLLLLFSFYLAKRFQRNRHLSWRICVFQCDGILYDYEFLLHSRSHRHRFHLRFTLFSSSSHLLSMDAFVSQMLLLILHSLPLC